MTAPDDSEGRVDVEGGRRELSRRKVLWGLASTGAAASAGGGTAALLSDEETFAGLTMTAGTLDLKTAWGAGNDGVVGGVPTIDLGEAQEGDSGQFRAVVDSTGNPAYVWFRTKCPRGTAVEEALEVTVRLETEEGSTTLAGPATLREVRDTLGTGTRLDEVFSPDETWRVVVEWEVVDSPDDDATVTFEFDFVAKQTRHVGNTEAVWPDAFPDICEPGGGNGDGNGDGGGTTDISWVAFCAENEPVALGDVDFEISADGSTLTLNSTDVPLDEIVLKYATYMDVFENPGGSGSFTAGSGDADETYVQNTGNGGQAAGNDDSVAGNNDSVAGNNANVGSPGTGGGYEGTNRTNSDPCPRHCWLKYETDDGTTETECDLS